MWGINDIIKGVDELLRRGSFVSFALASAVLAAAVVFALLARFDPDNFAVPYRTYGIWFWLESAFLFVFAAFLRVRERGKKSVNIVPVEHQCDASAPRQPDGSVHTHLSCHFDVFNLTNAPIRLPQVRLIKPRPRARVSLSVMTVQQHQGSCFGDYQIPAGCETAGHAIIFIDADLTDAIRRKGVVLKIGDHLNRWHKVRVRDVRIMPSAPAPIRPI